MSPSASLLEKHYNYNNRAVFLLHFFKGWYLLWGRSRLCYFNVPVLLSMSINGSILCKLVANTMSTSPKAPNARWGNLFAFHKMYCAMLPAAAFAKANVPVINKVRDICIMALKPSIAPVTFWKSEWPSANWNITQGTNPATNPTRLPLREKRWGLGWGASQLMYRFT